MPAEALSSEYTPLIAQKEDKILIHTVLLPDHKAGHLLCDMSQAMLDDFPDQSDIYYHLMPHAEWHAAAEQLSKYPDEISHSPLAENKESYPHLTLFHAWMAPADADIYLQAVIDSANRLKIPDSFPMTNALKFHIPHWYNTAADAQRLDDVRWTGVKPDPLVALQSDLSQIARTYTPDAQITTALGAAWTAPHFTLFGCRDQNGTAAETQDRSEPHMVHPTLAIGVSGGNGQFRAPVAIINGSHGSTRPPIACGNLSLLRLFR